MKHIIDLEYLMGEFNNDEVVLDALYEHACELRITALITAIEMYWATQMSDDDLEKCKIACRGPREQPLSGDDFLEAQEQSAKEQAAYD